MLILLYIILICVSQGDSCISISNLDKLLYSRFGNKASNTSISRRKTRSDESWTLTCFFSWSFDSKLYCRKHWERSESNYTRLLCVTTPTLMYLFWWVALSFILYSVFSFLQTLRNVFEKVVVNSRQGFSQNLLSIRRWLSWPRRC